MRKIYLLFILLPLFSLAQKLEGQKLIDSLLVQTKNTTARQDILKLNFKIAKVYFADFNFDKATLYAKKNIVLASNLKLKAELAEANKFLVFLYINKPNADSAIYYNNSAIKLFRELKDKKAITKCLFYYSAIYQQKSDFKKQAFYNYESIKIALETKDTSNLENNHRALSSLFLDQKNFKKALFHSLESLKFANQLNNSLKIGNSESSLAETFSMMNDKINAEKYFKSAFEKYSKIDHLQGKAYVLTNWAGIKDKYSEELKMRIEAQSYWDIIAPTNMMSVNNLGNLGVLYFKMSLKTNDRLNLNMAESYLKKSLSISNQSGNVDNSVDFLQTLAKIQEKKGDYKNAYITINQYNRVNDSLFSQENKNKIAELESAKEIELRDKEIKINKLSLDAKEKQKWLFIAGIGFLVAIGGLLFYQSRKRKQINEKLQILNENLDLKNIELDQANKAKTRFFGILNHDLRGPVANLISFLQLQKESPEMLDAESIKRMQDKTMTGAENLLESMEDILQWSKSQMENFKPQPKKVFVSQLFDDTKKVFSGYLNIKIDYQNSDNIEIFTDDNYLKTIIRNLTSNAINILAEFVTSSFPTSLNTGFVEKQIIWKAWQNNTQSFLSITDNGPGVDAEKLKALFDESDVTSTKSGLGLHLIRDMAKAIDCEISVESRVGEGTTFTLKLN